MSWIVWPKWVKNPWTRYEELGGGTPPIFKKKGNIMKKIIGILGGMGPGASGYLYNLINALAVKEYGARKNQDFPEVVLYSVPVPDFISSNKNKEKAEEMLIDRTKRLNTIGVDFIGIACNTVHVLLPALQKVSKAKFVSMSDEVAKIVINLKVKTIGLLGTTSTIKSNLYQSRLKDLNIIYANNQKEVDRIIKNIIAGKLTKKDKRKLVTIANKMMGEGAEVIVLGCTELPLLFPRQYDIPVIRSTDVLAQALLEKTML